MSPTETSTLTRTDVLAFAEELVRGAVDLGNDPESTPEDKEIAALMVRAAVAIKEGVDLLDEAARKALG